MSAPLSRPVHPCVVNLSKGSRAAEFSTWAYITRRVPDIPNLVTASASSLNVYSVNPISGKLRLEHSFGNLAGSIVFLNTLNSGNANDADSLLVGFAGHPRLTVLRVTDNVLRAYCLVDLTVALIEASQGSTSVLEQDCITTCLNTTAGNATAATILGGGAAVAVFRMTSIKTSCSGWIADVPYILPLRRLSEALPHHGKELPQNIITQTGTNCFSSMATGFGDIISLCFLSGYLEPVLVLLHSDPGGLTWCGRLGRVTGGAVPVYISALSISVSHKRTALLWYQEVSSDSFQVTSFKKQPGCVVVAANSLTFIDIGGKIQQVVAGNGFARSTCPLSMVAHLKANPVVKLSISLHGSKIAWISEKIAFVALRMGQLYVLQKASSRWIVVGLGQKFGSIGEIASLTSVPLDECSAKRLYHKISEHRVLQTHVGLLLAGSRFGDSALLGFAVEESYFLSHVNDPFAAQISDGSASRKNEIAVPDFLSMSTNVDDVLTRTLIREEQALYDTSQSSTCSPDIVPPSDEEDEVQEVLDGALHSRKRHRNCMFGIIRGMVLLDSIPNIGPLGPPCEGPLSKATTIFASDGASDLDVAEDVGHRAVAQVFPCGYASSGGIAMVTVPGRDDRTVIAEVDCMDVDYLSCLPSSGIVILCMSSRSDSGARLMRLTSGTDGTTLSEINVDEWCQHLSFSTKLLFEQKNVFKNCTAILGSGEFDKGSFVLLAYYKGNEIPYLLITFKEVDGGLEVQSCKGLMPINSVIVRISPFLVTSTSTSTIATFASLWASGAVTISRISVNGDVSSHVVDAIVIEPNTTTTEYVDQGELELVNFYADKTVTAIDVFEAPENLFRTLQQDIDKIDQTYNTSTNHHLLNGVERQKTGQNVFDGKSNHFVNCQVELDKEDDELYTAEESIQDIHFEGSKFNAVSVRESTLSVKATFMALARRSGDVEVYRIHDNSLQKCWQSVGAAIGASVLKSNVSTSDDLQKPRSHMYCAQEIRFFSCSPRSDNHDVIYNNICLAIETNNLDIFLYKMKETDSIDVATEFVRIPTKSVSRASQEQVRQHGKSVRKGVIRTEISPNVLKNDTNFKFSNIFRFAGVSGQTGLFIAGARPFWVVSDRGSPLIVTHRARHAAPAGKRNRSVQAFCSGLLAGELFLTLHERVGREGSQRLTLYKGLSATFDSCGLLPGSGYCVERIRMGVTVRRVQFINDNISATRDHPLYAMLVSRELELDQGALNFDGLSNEERKRIQDERESAKIQRQVEADLGGFDMESEWVEEIEREECFRVDTDLGGAPPIQHSVYSLWIVDAANKWKVVDSFELGEHEYGLDLQVMRLTEFREEHTTASTGVNVPDEELPSRLFVVLGTGVVTRDGEDVSSKGRTLLFEIKRYAPHNRLLISQVAELSLCYEKEVFHGPVTSLSCLSSAGKNRLVIGAGSDINIEQWGNGKLTQVGFFRATMQVAHVNLFKTFFLLSDAYDSLYFLVWRESDKSLTLLAKDYDPVPVHAIGIMSSGAAVTFLCHDDRQNLQFFQYAPGEAAARGGNKLVCRADFHFGSQTTALSSYYCKTSLLVHSATPKSTMSALAQQDPFFGRQEDDRLGIYFGTTDGGLTSVVPLNESVYWRLLALQSVMRNALESHCALSERAWRLYVRTFRRGGCRSIDRKNGVIDGDVVLRFPDLPLTEQEDIASAIGSSVNLILDNLLELHCSSMIL